MSKDAIVSCYYSPSYHPDPRNAAQHGDGWTMWEMIRRAESRFPGHDQPKAPLWGYADESNPEHMARKIDAAADHGIDAFIFDWYYYDDGPYLERGLEHGFLGAPNNDRLKFAIMWANHDWHDIDPAKAKVEPILLYPGVVTPETFDRMTDHVVNDYFGHPSYWKIDGRPYFSIYDLCRLVRNFDSVAATREGLERFRAKTRAAGHPGLHINFVVWGAMTILPGEEHVRNAQELAEVLGCDSVASYTWVHHVAMPEFPFTDYRYMMDKAAEHWPKACAAYKVPYYPNVTMGWDASPRTVQSDQYRLLGYPFTPIIHNNTPENFEEALMRVRDFLADRPAKDRILSLNAWNEWIEGSYLEPDTVTGLAYLEAVKAVFG
ncbi:MAG: glycoside hydrolase family 99-like domain-containing protein [bacterium]|nr:glycoside hydrolase family 99-like domain-containing protein [bacterium]